MSHQDWNTVIFVKSEKKKRLESRKTEVTKQHAPGSSTLRDLENAEFSHLPSISHSSRLKIQKLRTSMKMTQKELATILNIPVSVIISYESGKVQVPKSFVSKLENMQKRKSSTN